MTVSTNGRQRRFRYEAVAGLDRRTVNVRGFEVGGGAPFLIAGPCAVEGEDSFLRIAAACKDSGAHALRGGAYKPRTSPYDFRGLGTDGLRILAECGAFLDLPVCTEVMDPRDVEAVAEAVDIVQIGARNMQNYGLLSEVGRAALPVLLKRGPGATVKEWLSAAEYILVEGNEDVILCERGIRTFESSTRFTLDVSAIPVVLEESRLPVIVDPSHAAGKRHLVPSLGRAGIAAGAHGLIVEVHDAPESAKCDGPQALLPCDLKQLAVAIEHISESCGARSAEAAS